MPANTAEYLYEIAKQLPASERIRLVEKIAHGLASPPEPASEPEVPARVTDGLSTRLHLVGQVTDLALDPLASRCARHAGRWSSRSRRTCSTP